MYNFISDDSFSSRGAVGWLTLLSYFVQKKAWSEVNEINKISQHAEKLEITDSKQLSTNSHNFGAKRVTTIAGKGVGRKISRGATEKAKLKNSTIKPPSTLSVSCIKIQVGAHGSLPPIVDAHGCWVSIYHVSQFIEW